MAIQERHPLEPFLPASARLLMLGSFPPPRRRWSMEFFYPNPQNDMWRIFGYLFTGDKEYFCLREGRGFDRERIERFCRERGVALYDTAVEVVRLKENAADDALEVVEPVDLAALLREIPRCRTIITTGGRASEVLSAMLQCEAPKVGESTAAHFADRDLTWWRLPSSSRAYPRPLAWKADSYRRAFVQCGILAETAVPAEGSVVDK